MNRADKIAYLARISPYFNLAALCRLYNETQEEPIDYNNLRTAVNDPGSTRLSDEKLTRFVGFVRGEFARTVLELPPERAASLAAERVRLLLSDHITRLCAQIEEEYR